VAVAQQQLVAHIQLRPIHLHNRSVYHNGMSVGCIDRVLYIGIPLLNTFHQVDVIDNLIHRFCHRNRPLHHRPTFSAHIYDSCIHIHSVGIPCHRRHVNLVLDRIHIRHCRRDSPAFHRTHIAFVRIHHFDTSSHQPDNDDYRDQFVLIFARMGEH